MTTQQEPFYKRLSLNLISLALLATLLYLGQGIIVPLLFSILLATLLLPVTRFLSAKLKFPNVLAIIVSILVSLLLIVGVIYLLSHQVGLFIKDSDAIKERFADLITSLQGWVDDQFHIDSSTQRQYVKDAIKNMKASGVGIVGKTFGTLTEMLSYVVFLPVYTFLILFYRGLIKKFLVSVFENANPEKVEDILNESRFIGQHYVLGLGIDMAIVFTLNCIGFLILGIKYAIFLALVAAMLNLIPYIGMLIANIFCMVITLISSESTGDVIWVAVILGVVQVVDNNFLMPMIVGNKVKINALVTILGVVVGGTLCGVSGMFLAIPGIAVLKVIFDRVDALKPWGIILGDDTDSSKAKRTIAKAKTKRQSHN